MQHSVPIKTMHNCVTRRVDRVYKRYHMEPALVLEQEVHAMCMVHLKAMHHLGRDAPGKR